jgi:hypothetical protein
MTLAGSAVIAQSGKSAEELYQSALVMKEGCGEVEAAIRLFARILMEHRKDSP